MNAGRLGLVVIVAAFLVVAAALAVAVLPYVQRAMQVLP